jgi:hypothetical protein
MTLLDSAHWLVDSTISPSAFLLEVVVPYGHAERNLVAARTVIGDTVELLLRLPTLNDEQSEFLRDFAAGLLGLREQGTGHRSNDFVARSASPAGPATTRGTRTSS